MHALAWQLQEVKHVVKTLCKFLTEICVPVVALPAPIQSMLFWTLATVTVTAQTKVVKEAELGWTVAAVNASV